MRISVEKTFEFHAAHYLPHHEGKCKNLHGHTYKLAVTVSGDVRSDWSPEAGMIMDFGKLKEIVNAKIINKYDHSNLNFHFENPTAEVMARKIFTVLQTELPERVYLRSVRLYETPTSCAIVEDH